MLSQFNVGLHSRPSDSLALISSGAVEQPVSTARRAPPAICLTSAKQLELVLNFKLARHETVDLARDFDLRDEPIE